MSRDKGEGEVVSVIISLVNNRYSCLVELLGHRQSTKILEKFFLTFYFLSVINNIFCLIFFKSHFCPHVFIIPRNLKYFSINFMLTVS